MARRKVTFVYEPGQRPPWFHPVEETLVRLEGVDAESVTVEEVPDPPRVDTYTVKIEREFFRCPLQPSEISAPLRLLVEHWPGFRVLSVMRSGDA